MLLLALMIVSCAGSSTVPRASVQECLDFAGRMSESDVFSGIEEGKPPTASLAALNDVRDEADALGLDVSGVETTIGLGEDLAGGGSKEQTLSYLDSVHASTGDLLDQCKEIIEDA